MAADRDWDKELAKIDKQLASLSDEALLPVAPDNSKSKAPAKRGSGRARRSGAGGAEIDVVVRRVRAPHAWRSPLGVAMAFWPYPSRCGLGLIGYLGAVGRDDGRRRVELDLDVAPSREPRSSRVARSSRCGACSSAPWRCCPASATRIPTDKHPAAWSCSRRSNQASAGTGARAHHTRALSDASEASGPNYETMKTFKNFIGGEWVPPVERRVFREPESGRRARHRSAAFRCPARPTSSARSSRRSAASRSGARRRRPRAATCCGASATSSPTRKEEIADLMTREMGKPLAETRGDVQEGIDTAYYAATRRTPAVRPHRAERVAQQVGDELPPADRRRGHHHAVQLSARDSDVEDVSGAACAETRASSSPPKTCRTPGTCSSRSCSRPGCRPK